MNTTSISILAALISTLFLVLFYSLFYFNQKERTIKFFTFTWVLYTGWFGVQLISQYFAIESIFTELLQHSFLLGGSYLFVCSSFLLFNKKIHRVAHYIFTLLFLWNILFVLLPSQLGFIGLKILFTFISSIFIYIGILSLKSDLPPKEKKGFAITVILWAIAQFLFMILVEKKQTTIGAYFIELFFISLIGIAVFFIYLKKTQQQFINNNLIFQNLTEFLPDTIIYINSDCIIKYVSNNINKYIDVKSSDLIDKHIETIKFLPITAQIIKKNNSCTVTNEVIWSDNFIFTKNNNQSYLEINLIPECNSEDNLIGYLILIKNITGQKKSEFELIKAKEKAEESERLKTVFLANMSHEIRTPMNGIIGFSEMLTHDNITTDKRKQFVKFINTSCNQLLSVINDIIEISKIESGQLKMLESIVNVNELLQEQFYFFSNNTFNLEEVELVISKKLPDEYSIICTDGSKIKQVLMNLISNAYKFTQEGKIEIGAELKTISEQKFVEFFVKDTGIGIDKKHFNVIFERFRQIDETDTRQYGGTGLGLTIAKAFVGVLKGNIYLESEPKKGSCFYFTVPYKDILDENRPTNASTPQKTTIKNILIAEDEKLNYFVLKEIIEEKFNVTIHYAQNGKEAIDLLKNNGLIDLVLMDIKMPEIDGLDATLEIRKIKPDIPVLAITAYSIYEAHEKAKEAHFNAFITKPITSGQISRLLKKYL